MYEKITSILNQESCKATKITFLNFPIIAGIGINIGSWKAEKNTLYSTFIILFLCFLACCFVDLLMMGRENVKPLATKEIKYGYNDLMCNVLTGILFLKITKKHDISSIKRESRTKGKKRHFPPKSGNVDTLGQIYLICEYFLTSIIIPSQFSIDCLKISFCVLHASSSMRHSLPYVLPSDPHTGDLPIKPLLMDNPSC